MAQFVELWEVIQEIIGSSSGRACYIIFHGKVPQRPRFDSQAAENGAIANSNVSKRFSSECDLNLTVSLKKRKITKLFIFTLLNDGSVGRVLRCDA